MPKRDSSLCLPSAVRSAGWRALTGASLSVIAREHDHQLRHLVPVTGIAPGYALLGVIECGDERVTCADVAEPCLGFDGPGQESDVLWRQRFCGSRLMSRGN